LNKPIVVMECTNMCWSVGFHFADNPHVYYVFHGSRAFKKAAFDAACKLNKNIEARNLSSYLTVKRTQIVNPVFNHFVTLVEMWDNEKIVV